MTSQGRPKELIGIDQHAVCNSGPARDDLAQLDVMLGTAMPASHKQIAVAYLRGSCYSLQAVRQLSPNEKAGAHAPM